MAERDFYNIGNFIAYPLVTDQDFSFLGGGELPRQGLADAGFMFGIDSGFVHGIHNVYLYELVVGGMTATFDFRSDAPGLAGYRWLFTFPFDAALGCADYVGVSPIIGGAENSDLAYGYLNVGDLSEIVALDPDTYILTTPAQVEPALLQTLANTFVRSVNLADDPRLCPETCCSSSSSSSTGDVVENEAILVASDITGDIKFKEGNNAQISIDTVLNAIVFGAGVGMGDGEVCHDLIIDHDGIRADDCITCDAFIRSINGIESTTSKLRFSGGAGFTVVPDPANHKIVVKVNVTTLCTSSSSSSGG